MFIASAPVLFVLQKYSFGGINFQHSQKTIKTSFDALVAKKNVVCGYLENENG